MGQGIIEKKIKINPECAVPFLSDKSTHEEIKAAEERSLI